MRSLWVPAIVATLALLTLLFSTLIGLEISIGLSSRQHLQVSNCTLTSCQLIRNDEFGTIERVTFDLVWNDDVYTGFDRVAVALDQSCPPVGQMLKCYFDDANISSSLSLHPLSLFNWSAIIVLVVVTGLNSVVLIVLAVYIYRDRQRQSYHGYQEL
jgi:hypothetical protein